MTNVREKDLKAFDRERVVVSVGKVQVQGLSESYAGAPEGAFRALINSWGLLEVSLYKGSAQNLAEVSLGEAIHVRGK